MITELGITSWSATGYRGERGTPSVFSSRRMFLKQLSAVFVALSSLSSTACTPPQDALDYCKRAMNNLLVTPEGVGIAADDGTILTPLLDATPIWVTYENLPPGLIATILCREDPTFFSHDGRSLTDAARAFIVGNGGASTITMQVVTQLIGRSQNSFEKLDQSLIAQELEKQFSKKQILEAYVNLVPMPNDQRGIFAAANNYWGTPSIDAFRALSLRDCSELSAMIRLPSSRNPLRDTRAANIGNANQVLSDDWIINRLIKSLTIDGVFGATPELKEQNFNTAAALYKELVNPSSNESAENLLLNAQVNAVQPRSKVKVFTIPNGINQLQARLAEAKATQLRNVIESRGTLTYINYLRKIEPELITGTTATIKTNLNLKAQRIVKENLQEAITKTSAKKGAAILLDLEGRVLSALSLAGTESDSPLDPFVGQVPLGSVAKIWALACGIENGDIYYLDDYVANQPITDNRGRQWPSRCNYSDETEPSWRRALAGSFNCPFAQLTTHEGFLANLGKLFERAGVVDENWTKDLTPAAVLGTISGSLERIARLGLMFFRNGLVPARSSIISNNTEAPEPLAVIRPNTAQLVKDALRGPLESGGTAYQPDSPPYFTRGAKTGTTPENSYALIATFSENHVLVMCLESGDDAIWGRDVAPHAIMAMEEVGRAGGYQPAPRQVLESQEEPPAASNPEESDPPPP